MLLFSECDALDAICTESLTSLSVTWMPFSDPESEIAELVELQNVIVYVIFHSITSKIQSLFILCVLGIR